MSQAENLKVNRPNVVDETIDGEALIVNLGTGVYYSLTGSAEVIWRLLADGVRPIDTALALQQLFEVAAEDASNAVTTFVDQLIEEELLVAENGNIGLAREAPPFPEAADGIRERFVAPELKRYADMQELLLLDPVHDVDRGGWPEALPPVSEENGNRA